MDIPQVASWVPSLCCDSFQNFSEVKLAGPGGMALGAVFLGRTKDSLTVGLCLDQSFLALVPSLYVPCLLYYLYKSTVLFLLLAFSSIN